MRWRLAGVVALSVLGGLALEWLPTLVRTTRRTPAPALWGAPEAGRPSGESRPRCPATAAEMRAFNLEYEGSEAALCGFRVGELNWRPLDGAHSAAIWKNYSAFHSRCRASGDSPGCRALVWDCTGSNVCGGNGDQTKGLASALYLAVLSSRVLFVRWERFGVDVLGLLEPGAVDVRPAKQWKCSVTPFERKKEKQRVPHYNWLGWTHDAKTVDQHVGELLGMADPCIVLQSNLAPESLSWAPNTTVGGAFGCLVARGYARGCAFRFLFRPGRDWLAIRDGGRRLHCGGLAPVPHVGIHIRLGDERFRQGGDTLGAGDMESLRAALDCASAMGTALFGPAHNGSASAGEPNWQVVLSSDSSSAKRFAADEARAMGLSLLSTSAVPRHSDLGDEEGGGRLGADRADRAALLDVWQELALLTDSAAVVRAPALSGFVELAAQVGLVAPDRIRDGRCTPAKLGCSPLCEPPDRYPLPREGRCTGF